MAGEGNDIKRYRDGSMSPAERHALEKKALSDPFLADALEGADSVSSEEFSTDLRDLTKKLQRRQDLLWFTPLRIAAGVVLLIGAGSVLYFMNSPEPVSLAMEKTAPPSPIADSLASRVDSSSTLLTLAQPKEPVDAGKSRIRASSGPDQKTVTDGTKTGATGEIAETETQPQPTAPIVAEEKSKVADEIVDDTKEVATQALASGTAGTKKAEQDLRKAKSKDIAAFSQNSQNIAGQVTSAENGEALPGVNVAVKGSGEGTVTDAQGNYQLNTQVANPRLVFSYIGMHSVETAPANNQTLDVQLKEDVSQLSEVVVTGMGAKAENDAIREPVIKMAAPAGGLRAYNKYLENNLRYPAQALEDKIKGKVTVQFTVTTDGSLTEFSVLKGLGHGCDDEVIRLVKEGPKWQPTTQDDVAVESEVRVKMKFDPEKVNR